MAYLESGDFCGIEEYKNGLPRRIHESQVQADELYTMMMSLAGTKHEAAKQAIRMVEIIPKSGMAVVHFAFLDEKLDPQIFSTQIVKDGLVADFQKVDMVDTKTKEKFRIQTAYFKDYFEDQFGDELTKGRALSGSCLR